MLNSATRGNAPMRRDDAVTSSEFFAVFKTNFTLGYERVEQAVKLEEKCKTASGESKKLKVRAGELYKEGTGFFKEALKVNYMDVPVDKREEYITLKERIHGYRKSAEERIISICDELAPNRPKTTDELRAVLPSAKVPPSARLSGGEGPSTKPYACGRDHSRSRTSSTNSVGGPLTGCNRPTSASRARKLKQEGSGLPNVLKTVQFLANDFSQIIDENHRSIDDYKAAARNTEANPGLMSRSRLLKGVDSKFGEKLLDEVLDNTGVKLVDVSGCETAKQALEEAVILPALNPTLFQGLRQPVKGILLFGPPGNGKTLLAKAVANESNQIFLNISASSLTSKWVGESEKTIRALFQIARNAQPSIIFIDEIDSLLTVRNEKETEVSRRMKTEFMVQLDGASSSTDERILIIGATNRPYELDDAILRRFPKRILIDVPDVNARAELIDITLRKHNMHTGLTSRDIGWIAQNTPFYSNADLVALCKEAAMVPIRELDRSKLAKTRGTGIRNLQVSDFVEALKAVKPSCSSRLMEELRSFAERAGQK